MFPSRESIEITKGSLKKSELSENFWGRILEYLETHAQPMVYMYYCIFTRHRQDLGNLKHNMRIFRKYDREGKKKILRSSKIRKQ